MLPIGPLMIEHRLIERMIAVIDDRLRRAEAGEAIDPSFAAGAIDFIRTYADRTHHGKEEDILFRDLSGLGISDEDARLMNDLIEEHKTGRRIVADLDSARRAYASGDTGAHAVIVDRLGALVAFYPNHIEKEDRVFFPASMEYLSDEAKGDMLERMWEFDRKMIHEKYSTVVEAFEKQT